MPDEVKALIAAYKAAEQLPGSDIDGAIADGISVDCDEIRYAILRVLRFVEPQAYLDCVCWEVAQAEAPNGSKASVMG
jgi:hypothetical protein